MDFMEFIIVSVPLALITGYVLKAIFVRKMPPLDDIMQWPHRAAEFEHESEQFNQSIDRLLKYNRYTVRNRTKDSVYLVEEPLKWKRTGFCFYVLHSESEKNIRIYFRSIFHDQTQDDKIVEDMLAYLRYQGSVRLS